MATATYVKFEQFGEHLLKAQHGDLNASGTTLRLYLASATPSDSADTVKADLASIAAASGYSTAGEDIVNSVTEPTAGIWALATTSAITWTSTDASAWPAFRYVVSYNNKTGTPLNPLISYWDYGGSVTMNSGDTFQATFQNSRLFTINCT